MYRLNFGIRQEDQNILGDSAMTRFSSIFLQLLQLFPRLEFEHAVKKEHKADKGAKGFTCWGQFVAMLFCQLGWAHSLREICGGLADDQRQLETPPKSGKKRWGTCIALKLLSSTLWRTIPPRWPSGPLREVSTASRSANAMSSRRLRQNLAHRLWCSPPQRK